MSHPSPTPFHGFGLGLRIPHYMDFLETPQPVDFVESFAEAYGGQRWIDKERARLTKAIDDAERGQQT